MNVHELIEKLQTLDQDSGVDIIHADHNTFWLVVDDESVLEVIHP